jgi:2-keto-4-pentenoate hydratase/2-oxohepta-3-ene-1,7-dioic acid hydratase in catechol pathway
MRYIRYDSPDGPRWGVLEGDRARAIRGSFLDRWEPTGETQALAGLRLLPPCEPTKVVAIGLNYRAHAAEAGLPVPDEPAMFLKPTTAIIGPGEAIVHPRRSARVDYECELACVIKTRAHRIGEADALRHVLGYTCLNDVTARDIQFMGGNLLNMTWSKGYDTFCPIGPILTDEIDPDDVLVEGYLNGRRVQSASTRDFIFSMARQVSWASHVMTLLPGDVLTSGTPPGIGPVKPGDVIEVRVSGIGRLSNPVVAEP